MTYQNKIFCKLIFKTCIILNCPMQAFNLSSIEMLQARQRKRAEQSWPSFEGKDTLKYFYYIILLPAFYNIKNRHKIYELSTTQLLNVLRSNT